MSTTVTNLLDACRCHQLIFDGPKEFDCPLHQWLPSLLHQNAAATQDMSRHVHLLRPTRPKHWFKTKILHPSPYSNKPYIWINSDPLRFFVFQLNTISSSKQQKLCWTFWGHRVFNTRLGYILDIGHVWTFRSRIYLEIFNWHMTCAFVVPFAFISQSINLHSL